MKKQLTLLLAAWFLFGVAGLSLAEEAAVTAAQEPAAVEMDKKENKRGYFLNRLLDFTDILTFGASLGAQGSLDVSVTDFLRFGFGYGTGYEVAKRYDRLLGVGEYDAGNISFLFCTFDRDYYTPIYGDVPAFSMYSDVFWPVNLESEIYTKKVRDPWAVSVRAGIMLNIAIAFHPVEFADFFAGIFGCDIVGDDR